MNGNCMRTLEELSQVSKGYWSERIISQLKYAVKLSEVSAGAYDSVIEDVVRLLKEYLKTDGCITNGAAQTAENRLQELASAAKSYNVICAAHAHIDMNWMWGFAETVAITLDTFRTMLNLMKEYPEFTFSQSQASVYKIVEDYDPVMLEEIRERVREGRWEVTASTWVETDKNMTNGESLARHILYTKKYLSGLLCLDADSLQLDFEPDTFGHSRNVPEILVKGGIKYYYHCRGLEGHHLYRWKSPSGSTVINYREPLWYNADIDSGIAMIVPEFCSKYGIHSVLKVYGVGDHGGGPSRRDIEKLMDMASWPVFPTITFGTFAQFFDSLEPVAEHFPVVDHELNFVFTGCYTSQSRIKLANRISEGKMNEAEAFSTLSALFANGSYPYKAYEEAWRKVLFNHFHDILPGSGVIETREYAMGQFQQVLAAANTGIAGAMRNIATNIDTRVFTVDEDIGSTNSEGAGVGYAVYDYGVPQTERGRGRNRILHFFNPSAHQRCEPVEVTLWDWPGDKSRLAVCDEKGKTTEFHIIDGKHPQSHPAGDYWGHKYMRLLVMVKVPAYGYSTYSLTETDPEKLIVDTPKDPRVEKADEYVLENSFIKVVFNKQDASIISLYNKQSGRELVDKSRPAGIFRLIEEDDSKGMTSWVVGRYVNVNNLNRNVHVKQFSAGNDKLRQWICYSVNFSNSTLDVTVSLDTDSSRLDFQVECDWQERSKKGELIPQLNFHMPVAYKCSGYKYDIPFGTIEREPLDMDVPANSWGLALPEEKESDQVMIVTHTKYGFRGYEDSLSVSLIRSSYDPDPYPENGIHSFRFALLILGKSESNRSLIEKAYAWNHPVSYLSGLKHEGSLPVSGGFIELVGGSAVLSAIKKPESDKDAKTLILRLYEVNGETTKAVVKFASGLDSACLTDLCENPIGSGPDLEIDENTLCVSMKPWSVATVSVRLGK